MTEQIFSLEFLFDPDYISVAGLEQKSAELLAEYMQKVNLQIEQLDDRRIRFSLKGPLEEISACHDAINDKLFDRTFTIRLIDEAGDEIRRRAYPIIAEIETKLRTFINRAMTEIMGFDWWNQVCPSEIFGNVKDREDKKLSPEEINFLHPVEITTFEELISIVTASSHKWKDNKNLSVSDLLQLLSDCDSIEQLRDKLSEQLEFSIWDKVFVRYFEADEETEQKRLRGEWDSLKEQITNVVIPARNCVMHHRPIHFDQLQELDRIKRETVALIMAAKTELTETERAEAREDSQEYMIAMAELGNQFAEVARGGEQIRLGTPAGLPVGDIYANSMRSLMEAAASVNQGFLEASRRLQVEPIAYEAAREIIRRQDEKYEAIRKKTESILARINETKAQPLYPERKTQSQTQVPTRPQVPDSEDENADLDSNDTPDDSSEDSSENAQ